MMSANAHSFSTHIIKKNSNILIQWDIIVGTIDCVFIDNKSGVTKCMTGEAWSAFS